MSSDSSKIVRAHCNTCLHETKHSVLATKTSEGRANAFPDDPHDLTEIDWRTTYSMLECCGCEDVTMKRSYHFSEWEGVQIDYYPPQVSRQLPNWHDGLPSEIESLLKEVYSALHSDNRRLALMGARALIDVYMNQKLGDIGGFEQKLKKLESEGLIGKQNREYLEAAIEAGHAAAHRGHRPAINEVNQVMDIVENVLHSYLLKYYAENIKAKTPKRSKANSYQD